MTQLADLRNNLIIVDIDIQGQGTLGWWEENMEEIKWDDDDWRCDPGQEAVGVRSVEGVTSWQEQLKQRRWKPKRFKRTFESKNLVASWKFLFAYGAIQCLLLILALPVSPLQVLRTNEWFIQVLQMNDLSTLNWSAAIWLKTLWIRTPIASDDIGPTSGTISSSWLTSLVE